MNKRLVGLDIIRVFSVFIICAFHTTIHLHCDYGFLQAFIRNGAVLMSTFFILSGFALTLSNGGSTFESFIAVKRFYMKRAISILPLYYVCAALHGVMWCLYYLLIKSGGGNFILKTNIFIVPRRDAMFTISLYNIVSICT